jgi:hypothetical protein
MEGAAARKVDFQTSSIPSLLFLFVGDSGPARPPVIPVSSRRMSSQGGSDCRFLYLSVDWVPSSTGGQAEMSAGQVLCSKYPSASWMMFIFPPQQRVQVQAVY